MYIRQSVTGRHTASDERTVTHDTDSGPDFDWSRRSATQAWPPSDRPPRHKAMQALLKSVTHPYRCCDPLSVHNVSMNAELHKHW